MTKKDMYHVGTSTDGKILSTREFYKGMVAGFDALLKTVRKRRAGRKSTNSKRNREMYKSSSFVEVVIDSDPPEL